MGKTIGCIPSIYISTKDNFLYNFKCMILISPIISSFKIINSYNNDNQCFHLLNNKKKENLNKSIRINESIIHTFIIHGKENESASFLDCKEFVRKNKIENSWFPVKGNHMNIFSKYRKKFFVKIKEFLKKIQILSNFESFSEIGLNDYCKDDTLSNRKIIRLNSYKKSRLETNLIKDKEDSSENRKKSDIDDGKKFYFFIFFSFW